MDVAKVNPDFSLAPGTIQALDPHLSQLLGPRYFRYLLRTFWGLAKALNRISSRKALNLLIGFVIIEWVQLLDLLPVRIVVDLRGLVRYLVVLPPEFHEVRVSTVIQVFQINCLLVLILRGCIVICLILSSVRLP